MKVFNLFFAAAMLLTISAYAQDKPMPLYSNGVPNSKTTPTAYIEKFDEKEGWVTNVSIPTLTPFYPPKGTANGTAVVICPGGGYAGLAIVKEGYLVAKEFAKIGVTAFVLKNRLPSDDIMVDKTIGPLQDAQQAIYLVRKHATEWGLKADKIGIAGFSAGGHLASTEGTHFDKPVIENKEHISLRPDFMVLLYPVITFGPFTHQGSKNNLIGKTPTPDLVDLYSNEKQVTPNTPITFLVQAADDNVVPIQNVLLFYDAMVQAKVKGELHVYQAGGHGFGLYNRTSKELWFDWCKNWMDENGLL